MPLFRYISAGSNTTVVDGPGQLHSIIASPANGGTLYALDGAALGVTPNYVTIKESIASNLGIIDLPNASSQWDFYGVPFTDGLQVAATSSSNLTVVYADHS